LKYYNNLILSEHRPVAATIKTAAIPQNLLCDNKTQHEKIRTGTKPHSNKN